MLIVLNTFKAIISPSLALLRGGKGEEKRC